MTKERWQALLTSLQIHEETNTYNALIKAYTEKHRHYHTMQHIRQCLAELDDHRNLAAEPDEVEFALWFHDAIYDPFSANNEEKSADWACAFLQQKNVENERVARIRAHILATQHQAVPSNSDSLLVIDIDLAILGAPEADYSEFERNVRAEYKWVPLFIYGSKRTQILKSFIDRPKIYSTATFIDRYEQRARINLAAAVTALSR